MLKRLALSALALVCFIALAAGSLEDWCAAYDLVAGEHGLPLVDAAGFEVDGSGADAYHVFYFDDDTALMLALEDDGVPFLCAVEGRLDDNRLGGILAAAMCASRDQSYDECLSLTRAALERIAGGMSEIEDETGGWYYAGGVEEEDGVKYVILGFSYVGMDFPDLDKGGPRDPEQTPGPEPEPKVRPTPTPKTDTPVHRA
ncbi:MAG: hypothetical protein J6U72_03510 [Clostridia bacterium]|nr:hypothetical protein [Clostridia bacterium]